MFRLSKGAEYAVRGMLHLSLKPQGETSDIEEISREAHVPAAYLAKIFQALARKGFVHSFRGPDGGFSLSRPPREITLLEIIETMEGPIYLNDCLIRPGFCQRDNICPVHDVWKEAQSKFLQHLKTVTFEDLAENAKIKTQRVQETL